MAACAIRYRLDGPGPAAFLVECDGRLRLYTRGVLGGVMPKSRLLAVLAERGCRWVPATGEVVLEAIGAEGEEPAETGRPIPADLLAAWPTTEGGFAAG